MSKYKFSKSIRPNLGVVIEKGVASAMLEKPNVPDKKIIVQYKSPQPKAVVRRKCVVSVVKSGKKSKRSRAKAIGLWKKGQKAMVLERLRQSLKPVTPSLSPDEINYRRDAPDNSVASPAKRSGCKIVSKRKRSRGLKASPVTHGDSGCQYSTPIPEGTYIIENGEPVFIKKRSHVSESKILHSSSDFEDTLTGLGHMARDNGKFGSFIGEDYSD